LIKIHYLFRFVMCLYLARIFLVFLFVLGSNAVRVNEHYPKMWILLKNKLCYVCFVWSGKILLITLLRFVVRIYLHLVYVFILRATVVTATDNVPYPSFVLMCGLFERTLPEFSWIY